MTWTTCQGNGELVFIGRHSVLDTVSGDFIRSETPKSHWRPASVGMTSSRRL